jgi:DNA polymerase III subunit delta
MKLDLDLRSPVYLLKGDDEILLGDAVIELVHALVGDADRSLMVDELDSSRFEDDGGTLHIGPLVDSAQTPPFLTDRRVVVGRQLGSFTKAEQLAPLLGYLADPLDTTSLVLVWERVPKQGAKLGSLNKKLLDAIKAAGGAVVDTGAGAGKARDQWMDDQLKGAEVSFDAAAKRLIADQVGDDAGSLVGLLATLEGVFGPGAKLRADDVEPYLVQEGGVKPYELTGAIDKGDVAGSLDKLERLLNGNGWHPLQVMGLLTNHYGRLVTLDGAGVGDEKAAAELLGMKGSTYPAKLALAQANTLGPERLAEFVRLLAQADLDLKGAKQWPPELVVEVLVSRLAARTPTARGSRARR